MKTEHYPSLELCKKLTEIGFPETEKFWFERTKCGEANGITDTKGFGHNYYVCPYVMEILDEIPKIKEFFNGDDKYKSIRLKIDITLSGNFVVSYPGYSPEFIGTLPNSLAELFIWLYKNNLLSNK